jgi:DNA repair protein RadA
MVAEASQVGTVMYIDSEFTWCPERQDQICKARNLDVELMHKNFMICRPEDYEEQLAKILTLPSPLDLASMDRPPFKLICVDSLLALVDDSRDFSGREKLPTRARIIRDMLHALRKHAIANKCAVVFTNQVSAVPDVTKFMASYQKEQGTGGNVTRHKPDIVLYYRRTKDPIRIARLMDSSSLPVGERVFMINEKGIDDIPDGDQAKWMQEMNTSSVDYTKIIDEVQSEDAEIDEIVDNAEVEDVVEE